MGSTIERPAWATRRDWTDDDGSGGAWVRDLPTVTIRGCTEFGNPVSDAESDITFELAQNVNGAPMRLEVGEYVSCGVTYRDPQALRDHAAALLAAADEWDRVTAGAR